MCEPHGSLLKQAKPKKLNRYIGKMSNAELFLDLVFFYPTFVEV